MFLLGESQGWGSLVGLRLWSHRVGHDWRDLAATAAVTYYSKSVKYPILPQSHRGCLLSPVKIFVSLFSFFPNFTWRLYCETNATYSDCRINHLLVRKVTNPSESSRKIKSNGQSEDYTLHSPKCTGWKLSLINSKICMALFNPMTNHFLMWFMISKSPSSQDLDKNIALSNSRTRASEYVLIVCS